MKVPTKILKALLLFTEEEGKKGLYEATPFIKIERHEAQIVATAFDSAMMILITAGSTILSEASAPAETSIIHASQVKELIRASKGPLTRVVEISGIDERCTTYPDFIEFLKKWRSNVAPLKEIVYDIHRLTVVGRALRILTGRSIQRVEAQFAPPAMTLIQVSPGPIIHPWDIRTIDFALQGMI